MTSVGRAGAMHAETHMHNRVHVTRCTWQACYVRGMPWQATAKCMPRNFAQRSGAVKRSTCHAACTWAKSIPLHSLTSSSFLKAILGQPRSGCQCVQEQLAASQRD